MLNQKNQKGVKNTERLKNTVIYDTLSTKVIRESDSLVFESGSFVTTDAVEAVAYLLTSEKVEDHLWDIKLSANPSANMEVKNVLYWLSGGDSVWESWDISWNMWCDNYADEYMNEMFNAFYEAQTLGDIRNIIYNSYKMDRFYEFALKNKIKRSH